MSKLHITIFTDPTCPFALSMEPTRWRLKWLYGDQLSWENKMIILSGYNGETSPMTPKRISASRQNLREQHGMPMNTEQMPRVPETLLACQNYIAIRNHAPDVADSFLRKLRVASLNNALIDDQEVIDTIITNAGLNTEQVQTWRLNPETEKALIEDAEAARQPGAQAHHFAHKLSKTSTGRVRYPASSCLFSIDETTMELPGFWPLAAYEAIIGNLIPKATRADDPKSAQEVLEWAGTALATIEVATIINRDVEEVRKELQEIATFTPVGQDGYWTL